MLRASLVDEKTGRKILVFGLEPENIKRMQQGRPIHFDAAELGVDCDILIYTGKNLREMAEQLGFKLN